MYSVQTANRFDALDEDAPKKQEPVEKPAEKKEPTPAPKPAPKEPEPKPLEKPRSDKLNKRGAPHEAGRGFAAGRGRGGRPPKREFDRHSGTGRGKEVQKDGSGAHNWGSESRVEPKDLVPVPAEAATEAKDAAAPAAAAAAGAEEKAPRVDEQGQELEEDEEPQMSFDDFLKQRAEAKVEVDEQLSLRKVKDPELDKCTVWDASKDMPADLLGVKAEDEEEKDKKGDKKAKKSGKTVISLDEFTKDVPRRGGRGRGRGDGRGRGRGDGRGRGRGAPRRNFDAPMDAPQQQQQQPADAAAGAAPAPRGGDDFAPRGRGRGAFRGSRGGRGMPRGGPRGGRGDAPAAAPAHIDLTDASAFPSLKM